MMVRAWVLFLLLAPAAAVCQTPDFRGTWRLDEARSSVALEAPLAGLIGAGAPPTLHVTQPANGTLVVESQINESHARLYVPGEETTTPVFLGEAGTITITTRWEGSTLVGEGVRESQSGPSTKVKEVFAVNAEGPTLEVEIVSSTAEGTSSSSLTYERVQGVGTCDSWPSPCKDFTPANP